MRLFKETLKYLLTIFIVIFIVIYVARFQQIIGPSMSPNLEDGNVILVSRIHTHFFRARRGDIIAFLQDDRHLIKRIIGLPGEYIEFKNNYLYINGNPFEELYISTNTDDFSLTNLGYEIIPEGMFLVLGDNREDSLDSRDFGLIQESDIAGRAILRIWPINRFKLIR